MKKKILTFLVTLGVILLPLTANASLIDEYEHKNFKDTLAAESIELKNKDYKETDDQITIYMFRGQGCAYCRSFLEFLNSISNEYGKYFKLVSFEVISIVVSALSALLKLELITNSNLGS